MTGVGECVQIFCVELFICMHFLEMIDVYISITVVLLCVLFVAAGLDRISHIFQRPVKLQYPSAALNYLNSSGRNMYVIQSVPLPTKHGSSLIIPKPMKILQRDLNSSTFLGEK
jgi:hypothetical protein